MNKRTELLLNDKGKDSDMVLSKFVIELSENGSVTTSLDKGDKAPEEMTVQELEKSAEAVVGFFKDELITRAIRWNIDLGADKRVIKHMIADWIKQGTKMLIMSDEEWDELISDCKQKGKK